METDNNYANYSLEELLEARTSIDPEAEPQTTAELDRLIAERSNNSSSAEQSEASTVPESTQRNQVNFHGQVGEFFRIWIVNTLLSIVTLGIYSAWAKVRTNRYFYGNTEIGGHRFTYLAEPLQILKGRILAVILFVIYFTVQALNPAIGALLIFVYLAATPWLVVMSMRFNLRMTAYRNVRFRFGGSYGKAFVLFVVLPIVSVFTLYLLMPWVLRQIDEYLLKETSFGDADFTTELSASVYYKASFASVLAAIAIFGGGFMLMGLSFEVFAASEDTPVSFISSLQLFALYIAVYAVSSSIYQFFVRNHLFGSSTLVTDDKHEVATFESNISLPSLLVLRVTNILAIICSAGLSLPWVKIRTARFFADATVVHTTPRVDSVLAGDSGSAGAVAEEAATLFDVDVSLG